MDMEIIDISAWSIMSLHIAVPFSGDHLLDKGAAPEAAVRCSPFVFYVFFEKSTVLSASMYYNGVTGMDMIGIKDNIGEAV
ncbi:MAG: hypothetical protein ACOX6S_14235 [Clostridia bacterium]|jgi:hypothetical protein